MEDVNNRFYKAFQSLSIEEMEKVWDHSDDAVCIHPGWDLFTGWIAIRESWMTIFENTTRMEFLITNVKIKMFGDIAVVVCLENIESTIYEHAIKSGVLATNIFKKLEGDWFMIHHHGSIVTNYLPPNVST